MTEQVVVVIQSYSENQNDAKSLIKQILDEDNQEMMSTESEIYWNISNKYYKTDVLFHIYDENFVKDLKGTIEGVILLLDSTKISLEEEKLKAYLKEIEEWSPEIKLLICKKCSDLGEGDTQFVARETILKWCLKNQFELIEMLPESEELNTSDFGVKRIITALHSHTWPNLKMNKTVSSKMIQAQSGLKPNSSSSESKQSEAIDEAIGVDSFDEKFKSLIDKINSFSSYTEDRIQFAENATKAFWEIIGGDEDEFDSD